MTDTLTFFLGRQHHAEKLIPLANAFSKQGLQIDVLVTNNSINIDPPTEFLYQYGINSCRHVWDYLDGKGEDIDKMIGATLAECLPSDLIASVPPFWVIQGLREAGENAIGMGAYLREIRPKGVFALHEQNFFVKILFYQTRLLGTPTFSLQEGIILSREEDDLGKYSTATQYTTRLFSWSEDDKKYYSDADKIVPVGPSHLDQWIALKANRAEIRESALLGMKLNPARKTIIFAPPRLDLYRGDFFRALELLLVWSENNNHNLIVSFHPFESKALVGQVASKYTSRFANTVTHHKINGIPALMSSDVAIGQNNTFALEANALGIPVIEWDADYIGLEQSLSDREGVYILEGNDLGLVNEVLDESKVEKILPLADGRSTERIVRNVMEIING